VAAVEALVVLELLAELAARAAQAFFIYITRRSNG
jgi:hypothetical protein